MVQIKNSFSHTYLRITGILGAIAVIAGAFGSHSLKSILSPEAMNAYQIGVQYHFLHTLAILGVIALSGRFSSVFLKRAVVFFLVGILLFSGSLYLMAIAEITNVLQIKKVAGPLTPIGGVCFIIGWIMLFLVSFNTDKNNN